MKHLTKEEVKSMSEGIGVESVQTGCQCKAETLSIEKALPMSEAEKYFAGIAILVFVFAIVGYWVPEFRTAAITQFGALVGAACLKIKGSS